MASGADLNPPFKGGLPLTEEQLQQRWGGLKTGLERVDGPAPPGSANRSSGGYRRIKSVPDKRADIRVLIAVIDDEELWKLADELEEFYADPGRPGPPRGYNFMDILVEEIAVFLHVSRFHAHRNLDDTEWYWDPLRAAAQQRFPKHKYSNWEARRLSPTAPSRSQSCRARRQYLVGDALEKFRRSVRRTILKAVRECGLLDPAAGTWTHPARSQIVAADKTNMHAATRWHRDDPPDPDTGAADQGPEKCARTVKSTGKPCRLIATHSGHCRSVFTPRRCDQNADYFHLRNNTLSSVPGRELICHSVRGDDPNVRFILDLEFMKRKDDPERVTEPTQAVEMLGRLIDENSSRDDNTAKLATGIRGLAYDMALTSESIDKLLNRHLLPVVKVPKLKGNRFRGQALGPHRFTTAAGDDLDVDDPHLDVRTLNGCPWVWMPSGNKLQAVPLKRRKLQWGTQGKKKTILYMRAAIPNDNDIPEPWRGATTMIRVNSTDAEINNKPRHTRRSLSLRAIPEADPHFAKIFGVREDIESTFSNLKYLTRAKLKSTDDDQNLFTFTAYMLLWMSRAKTAYYKSLAANPAQAIPIAA